MQFSKMFSLSLTIVLLLQINRAFSHSQCGGGHPPHPPPPSPNYEDNNWNNIYHEFNEDEDIFDGRRDDDDESIVINLSQEDGHYTYDPEKHRQIYDYEEEHGLKIEVDYKGLTTENEMEETVEHPEFPELDGEEYGSEATDGFDFRQDAEERLRSHYALDHRKTTKLALVEQKIYIYTSLKKYLADVDLDATALNGTTGFIRAMNVSANPLLAYRMIRRIVSHLTSSLMELCELDEKNSEIIEAIQSSFAVANLSFPTNHDLNDALLGITRIHYVYGYNASDLGVGIIGNLKTNAILNIEDTLELANYLLDLKAYALAYQWLTAAEASIKDVPKGEKETATRLLESAWQTLLTLTKLQQIEDVHRVLRGQIQQSIDSDSFHPYQMYASCRGEIIIPEDEAADRLCFLDLYADPYWAINPLKVELVKFDPPIWLFHDFISDDTIAYIKKSASRQFARSGVVADSGRHTEYTNQRTSMMTWIFDYYENDLQDPELHKLNRRMELLTGLEIIKPKSSHALQVVEYSSLGGHYDFHNDALQDTVDDTGSGDRIATLLMFLSDVPLGGYTAFPSLNIAVPPEKGSAILWFPLQLNGDVDSRTLHGGCPTSFGTKLAANKWILHNENFLKYQCSVHPDA